MTQREVKGLTESVPSLPVLRCWTPVPSLCVHTQPLPPWLLAPHTVVPADLQGRLSGQNQLQALLRQLPRKGVLSITHHKEGLVASVLVIPVNLTWPGPSAPSLPSPCTASWFGRFSSGAPGLVPPAGLQHMGGLKHNVAHSSQCRSWLVSWGTWEQNSAASTLTEI